MCGSTGFQSRLQCGRHFLMRGLNEAHADALSVEDKKRGRFVAEPLATPRASQRSSRAIAWEPTGTAAPFASLPNTRTSHAAMFDGVPIEPYFRDAQPTE